MAILIISVIIGIAIAMTGFCLGIVYGIIEYEKEEKEDAREGND